VILSFGLMVRCTSSLFVCAVRCRCIGVCSMTILMRLVFGF